MLFGKKERQTEELIKRHIEAVGNVVTMMQQAVQQYCKDCTEFAPKAKKVLEGESEADGVRREFEMTLYDGAFMPIQRGDYAKMIEAVDKIANQCEAVAQFMLLTKPDIDEATKKGLMDIMDVSVRCYQHLPAMFESFEDGRKVMELSHKVEEDEQRVDDIFAKVVTELFESDLDLARKLHIKLLLDRAAAISNRTEDASDRFCIIMTARP